VRRAVLENDFQCRGCGLRSTLDSLYLDGAIECSRCGMSQVFDVSQGKLDRDA
jgi:transcription elongation factor Elf1